MMANKLGKYRLMKESARLAPHLPETTSFAKSEFDRLLDTYNDIVVKPNGGSGGQNVIRVFSSGDDRYTIHHEKKKISLQGKAEAYLAVMSKVGQGNYIIQRRIPLATVNGRPFDIRIIVQRRIGSDKWIETGKVAKLAGKGYIVTNLTRSKGKPLQVSEAIRRSSIKAGLKSGLISKLNTMAVYSAYILRRIYPKHRIYGLDAGIDNDGHTWIIEANKYPAMSHFRKLGNKSIIRRIMNIKHGR